MQPSMAFGSPIVRRRAACSAFAICLLTLFLLGCWSSSAEHTEGTRIPMDSPSPLIEGTEGVTLTVVYDNHDYDPRLRSDWGFACLVELEQSTLLFDSGGNGDILLANMSALELDPLEIDHVFLSHIHGDHTGGLAALLATGVEPVVWVPRSFPVTFKERVRAYTELREVSSATEALPGVHTTGELGSDIIEQSLVLETDRGLVVITGCAHPGIVSILNRVKELHSAELHMVVGGFHLGGKSRAELERIVAQMHVLGVQRVAPCHCTGDEAIRIFADEWDGGFVTTGVGTVIAVTD
jgi:7,8-dihydropterin-6-yl-methyl-4-(beta-D-ribofuranosyl)aminobenzene 5'-phosphate synthase